MSTNAWRWFPYGLVGAMALTFVVNGYMVYDAVSTFPGAAGTDGFDLSNGYGRVMAAEQRHAALGWQADIQVGADHTAVLRLSERNGTPLIAMIDAQAERPVGPRDSAKLRFMSQGNGLYQADTPLFSGQWDIMLAIHANGQSYTMTRRVIVR
jgi:nitrogen fixation protein FixH